MSVRTELAKRFSGCTETLFPRNQSSALNEAYVRGRAEGARYSVWELAVSYALILSVNWTSGPIREWLFWAAVAWIGGSAGLALIRTRSVQFRVTEFRNSLWIVGAALMLAIPMVAIAAEMQTLQQPYGPMGCTEAFAGYAVWAIAQQWLLQGYFFPRLRDVTGNENWAAAIVACLFAIAHLPNVILAVMALFWGLTASYLFLRFRSIVTLGFAHAVLGIAVAISIPGPVLHNMRVGIAYLDYRVPAELRDVSRMTNGTWHSQSRAAAGNSAYR